MKPMFVYKLLQLELLDDFKLLCLNVINRTLALLWDVLLHATAKQ